MNEERFLRSRCEREKQRQEKKGDGDDEDDLSLSRLRFHAQMDASQRRVLECIVSKDFEQAKESWREMQVAVRAAVEVLPSREQEQANSLLADLLSSIQTAEGQKVTKKFKFSAKEKVREGPAVAPAAEVATGKPNPEPRASPQAGDQVIAGRVDTKVFVPTAKAVFIESCSGATIYALPTAGSLFVSRCVKCTIYCAPHQLRMFECKDVRVFTWCRSIPVIEGCSGMVFGGYSAWTGLEDAEAKVREAGQNDLEWSRKSHTLVDDFHWLRQTASPNWSALPESEWAADPTPFCS